MRQTDADTTLFGDCTGNDETFDKDITTFGLLFESLVVHDLRVYADAIGARVYKYRDSKKRETYIPEGCDKE